MVRVMHRVMFLACLLAVASAAGGRCSPALAAETPSVGRLELEGSPRLHRVTVAGDGSVIVASRSRDRRTWTFRGLGPDLQPTWTRTWTREARTHLLGPGRCSQIAAGCLA